MGRRIGKTAVMDKTICVAGTGTVAGPVEGEGPFGRLIDQLLEDDTWGEGSWEKAETKMFYEAVRIAVGRSQMEPEQIGYLLGGDLLNQLIASSFAARNMDFPFIGLYGACSTMAESLAIGSMLIDGGFASSVACCASSHFSTAERQFRLPLEMGAQRPPVSQRTVTGAGATVVAEGGRGARVTHATMGRVIDLGIRDANNMGAAMAPAAADTILAHLHDTQTRPEDYDMILTGDLGMFGRDILNDRLKEQGVDATKVLDDCGCMMFFEEQDAHMGGSGCACSAVVLNSSIIPMLQRGELKRVLFVATGALLSTVSSMQGESIPSVAHAVRLERME